MLDRHNYRQDFGKAGISYENMDRPVGGYGVPGCGGTGSDLYFGAGLRAQ